jgi:hypothetical protein
MAARAHALEHAASRPARYLREHRLRLSLWIAAIEGLLVVIHVIPHLVMYTLFVVAIVFWATVARRYTSPFARQLTWVFAASQTLAVLVPIVLFVAKWTAITAIVILAVVALVFLFLERDRV